MPADGPRPRRGEFPCAHFELLSFCHRLQSENALLGSGESGGSQGCMLERSMGFFESRISRGSSRLRNLPEWLTQRGKRHPSSSPKACSEKGSTRGANSKPPEAALPNRLRKSSLLPQVRLAFFARFRNNLRRWRSPGVFSVLWDLRWGAIATWPVAAVGPGFRPRILSFSSYRRALFNRVWHSEGPSATLARAMARHA